MMYVCMLLPQAEGQGAGWPPVRRPLGPVWQPGEREKGAPSIGSSRAGDHELTWLGRDSMSFADVGEDAEAGGVQLHRRRRQLQGGAVPPTDLRGIAQKMQGPENVYMVGPSQHYLASCMCNTSLYIC